MTKRDDGAVIYPAPDLVSRAEVESLIKDALAKAATMEAEAYLAGYADGWKGAVRMHADRAAALDTAKAVLG